MPNRKARRLNQRDIRLTPGTEEFGCLLLTQPANPNPAEDLSLPRCWSNQKSSNVIDEIDPPSRNWDAYACWNVKIADAIDDAFEDLTLVVKWPGDGGKIVPGSIVPVYDD